MLRLLDDDGWSPVRTAGGYRHYRHPIKPALVEAEQHLEARDEGSVPRQAGIRLREAGESVPEPADAAQVTLLDPTAA